MRAVEGNTCPYDFGNNGAFYKSIRNAFRGLLPLGLGYSIYNYINSSDDGL